MARRSNAVRLLGWALGGLALGVALAFLALNVVARSEPGRKWVLAQTLSALGKGINGKLAIARIDGNLFEGARLYGLRLSDADGRPFLVADSAFADYDVRTLLSPRIVITRLTLYDPEIYAFKMPGDTLWNFEAIFADTTAPDTAVGPERATLVGRLRVVSGEVRVETPFEVDSTLSPAAQRRALREALADSSPLVVRRVPGGYVRTIALRGLQGVMRDVRFAPGSTGGSRFDIDTLRGDVHFYRRPIQMRHFQGSLALFNDRVEFDAPVARLPGSRLAVSGVVRFGDFPRWFDPAEGQAYDVAVRGDSVALRDFQWLYPRFPADAGGSLTLLVESRPEGTMITARDARISAPGTRIDGSFGFIIGDTLRFVDMDVRAEPIRTSFIERMLPDGLPVRGLVLGGVEIRGDRTAARGP